MVGIKSISVHIPFIMLPRELISKAWGSRSLGGQKSVANYDEDSITMAVEAASGCLNSQDRQEMDSIFFCSTTSPYKEKQSSTTVATATDLKTDILACDFANSIRAGSLGLRLAINSVKSGAAKNVMVVASDCRIGYPQSEDEQLFGDGAAAVVVGEEDPIATIEYCNSLTNEITDIWRTEKDQFVRSWESRWVLTDGYTKTMSEIISGMMKEKNFKPDSFSKVVLYAPDQRTHRTLAQSLKFDIKEQLQDPLISSVGNTGTASIFLMLAAAFEDSKPGDKILLVSYGDGADIFILKVTDKIKEFKPKIGLGAKLSNRKAIMSYEKYLSFKNILETVPEAPFSIDSAATVLWRDKSWVMNLNGSRCKKCGLVSFPIQRVCFACQSKDDLEEVRLSDKEGKVFTYSLDYLAGTPAPPVVQTVLESSEGSARIYCMMTDVDPKEVKVDMEVKMTFRRIREARGFYNYFWKCRPLRGGF
jgi:hydroxymethylglutaryl-CoA synthase